jgi:hypothetical protein
MAFSAKFVTNNVALLLKERSLMALSVCRCRLQICEKSKILLLLSEDGLWGRCPGEEFLLPAWPAVFFLCFSIPGRFFGVGFRVSVLIVGCIYRGKL